MCNYWRVRTNIPQIQHYCDIYLSDFKSPILKEHYDIDLEPSLATWVYEVCQTFRLLEDPFQEFEHLATIKPQEYEPQDIRPTADM
jgi:hypothetical protein